MIRKSILAMIMVLSMAAGLIGCGSEADTDSVPAPSGEQASENPEALEEAGQDSEEVSDANEEHHNNELVIVGRSYTGLTNIKNENNDDGTYFYEDLTSDGITVITNMSYPNSQRDGQDPGAYVMNIICAQIDGDAKVDDPVSNDALSEKFTYPVYTATWESGSNEDSKKAIGVVVLTDLYTYYYGFECPLDYYEDNEEFYKEELADLSLSSIGDAGEVSTGAEYVGCYLDIATELAGAGTADSFALIDVDADGVPELAAVDSKGEQREEGNAFLFTSGNKEAVKLLSVNAGYDGAHIYISAGKNTILETGGMMGTEFYTLYDIADGKPEKTNELKAICDPETDEYTYYEGETGITEKQYADEFAKLIGEFDPFTGIDTDGLNEVNISFKDGFVDYETVSTQKYMTLDELKDKLK